VIQGAVDSIRPAADAKQLALELLVDPGAGMVLGDALRLQQVVSNLLSNAVKFTPAGGRIELRLASADTHVELTVIDTGQGIAPEFMPDLFLDHHGACDGRVPRPARGPLSMRARARAHRSRSP